MEVVVAPSREAANRMAADMITALVQRKPDAVLGLATGSTPVGMYNCLAEDVAAGKVSFK